MVLQAVGVSSHRGLLRGGSCCVMGKIPGVRAHGGCCECLTTSCRGGVGGRAGLVRSICWCHSVNTSMVANFRLLTRDVLERRVGQRRTQWLRAHDGFHAGPTRCGDSFCPVSYSPNTPPHSPAPCHPSDLTSGRRGGSNRNVWHQGDTWQ